MTEQIEDAVIVEENQNNSDEAQPQKQPPRELAHASIVVALKDDSALYELFLDDRARGCLYALIDAIANEGDVRLTQVGTAVRATAPAPVDEAGETPVH